MAVKLPDELQQTPATQPKQTQGNVGSSQVTGSNGSSGGSSYSTSFSATVPAELPEVPKTQLPEQLAAAAGSVETPVVPDAPDLRPELDRWLAAAQQQANNQVDYATETGIRELQRAQEDAQPEFQKQRNQIAIDEQRALDNQALYAETRGDRGGIGQAQYNSIQNTAMQNRLQVQQQQTKLATDTARQIADLRARGEFEKADKALELTQSYLSQLMQLEQWAANYNMDAAQFRWSIEQWKADYEVQLAQILEDQRQWEASYGLQRANFLQGQYEWTQQFQQAQEQWEYEKQQDQQKTLAGAGEALLSAGIMPSDSQLAAMGMTRDQARSYISAILLAQTAGSSNSGRGGSGGGGSGGSGGSGSGGGGDGGDNPIAPVTEPKTPKISDRDKTAIRLSQNPKGIVGASLASALANLGKTGGNGNGNGYANEKHSTPITYHGKKYYTVSDLMTAMQKDRPTTFEFKTLSAQLYSSWGYYLGGSSSPGGAGGNQYNSGQNYNLNMNQ